MIRAGRLDRLIDVQRDTPTRDDHGNDAPGWALLFSCWAQFIPGAGRERREAARDQASVAAVFRVRWADGVEITANDRIVFDGVVWDINNKVPHDRDGYEIAATTGYEPAT